MTKRTFFSPAFRSRRFGHRYLSASGIVWVGLSTIIVPPILLIALGLPFYFVGTAFENETVQAFSAFMGLGFVAPFVSIFATPFALLLGAWAMRFGYAGWAVALLAGFLLPIMIGALSQALDPSTQAIGAMVLLSPIVLLHAAVLWVATRLFCPSALQE